MFVSRLGPKRIFSPAAAEAAAPATQAATSQAFQFNFSITMMAANLAAGAGLSKVIFPAIPLLRRVGASISFPAL
jgi:hypothetical protein